MATASIGNVVKFKNDDGTLSGGTLVDFTKVNGEDAAVINTFDGKRAHVPNSKLILIPMQRDGKTSSMILKRTKNEVKVHNNQLKEYGRNDHQKTLEEKIKSLQEENKQLLQEKNSLNAKLLSSYADNKSIKEYAKELEDKLSDKELELSKVDSFMSEKMQEKEDYETTIEALSNTIVFLKSNSEADAFEILLKRIKAFHNI